jgi:predicted deacylase
MLFTLGFQFLRSFFIYNTTPVSTETSPNLPRLIALESTGIPSQATHTSVPTTSTPKAAATPSTDVARSTSTPLSLLHDQQPDAIGYSTEGRLLNVYTFGSGEHQRMIVADIHGGDEWNTLTLANQLIQYLNKSPNVIPDNVTLYILPSLNPDGEARSHDKYGRLNHHGVDLNRNFPVNWLADWDRAGCWNYLPSSGGTGPGSEAETRVLMDFISSHKIEALISYHSAALGIFPGGDPWDENSTRLAQSIAQFSTYRFPPLDTGCTYSGTLPDYAVSKGIAAVDIELTNHIETDFDMNLEILKILLNWE